MRSLTDAFGLQTISVIVPMYNEAENARDTATSIVSTLNEHYGNWELLVVDDGSTDSTLAIAQELALKNPKIKVLHHARNFGPGRALRTGFEKAKGDIVVTIDADLSYDPRYITTLVDTLERSDADLVLASPYAEGKVTGVPIFRLMISKLGNMVLGYALRSNVKTLTGIFRAYKKETLDSLDLKSDGKEIEPEIVAKAMAMGFEIQEVPAELRGRERGTSKFSARKAMIAHLRFTLELRPMMLFALVGITLFFLGIATNLYLLYELFILHLGIMRPILIFGTLLLIAGIQAFMFGFMCDQLSLLKSEVLRNRREIRERSRPGK